MVEHVINDGNWTDQGHVNPFGLCGCLHRREPYGALPFASTAPVDLIPMEEWPARIKEHEANQSSLWHIWRDSPIGVLNQNPYQWCWAFDSTFTLMMERAKEGLPYRPLSPSSVAGPVVNYVDKGWYIEEALNYMVTNGVATTDYVPQTTNDRSKFKLGWKESAAGNKVTKWRDIAPRDFQAQGSLVLQNNPVAAAVNWMGHAIPYVQLLDRYPNLRPTDFNRYGMKYVNSWGKAWGDNGCGIFEGSRWIADSAYSVESTSFVE